jgi:PAS domain S-box-containing protein
MQLHIIVTILALLAVLSALSGGYLYYDSLAEASVQAAEREGHLRLRQVAAHLSYALFENIDVVRAMAGMTAIHDVLLRPTDPRALRGANHVLELFVDSLAVDVCYVMNRQGDTIASSNHDAPDSFVGQNFSFRPYFREGFAHPPATYLALGVTSGKRGVYHSHPIYDGDTAIGLVVLKRNIELVERELALSDQERMVVIDPQGIVFISNVREWLFGSVVPLSAATRARLAGSRQFGSGPWPWIGLQAGEPGYLTDRRGQSYEVFESELQRLFGWRVLYLRSPTSLARRALSPFLAPAGIAIMVLVGVVGVVVALLYLKANREIRRRRAIERALRDSEARHRSLYHRTPAMLHSIDPSGNLVSVSDYWLEALGFERDAVIGRPLTNFFTESSRQYNRQVVFPEFIARGFCEEIPYQFVRKNGEIVDVLLSAIAERDSAGRLTRSLAVSIDVTERKKAEEALRAAKEELSQYSKELERIVRERTREIMDILANTPAVVYVKDVDGRYRFVNARFEALFGISNAEAQQKTDYDILPKAYADKLLANDRRVVIERRARQVEEEVPHADGVHTYLSVKFPIFDESHVVKGVCGISTDITEVKRAETQLRRLSDSILANQENERTALARELHDELGQNLTALRMETVWLRARLNASDSLAERRASEMCDLIDKTIEDVRGLAFRLRPEILDDLGLVDALDQYTTDFERRTGIPCVFEHEGLLAPENTVATAAYRITQEALTNVARHAGANHVDVSLSASGGVLRLAVRDDGCGFAAEALGEFGGLGLLGMRERASLVGGDLVVESRVGSGTQVSFQVGLGRSTEGVRS